MLSVVIPVFNEEETLNIAADKVKTVLKKADIDFEIFFIDDGSTDRSWRIISELHAADRRIKGIRFSRNFGKDTAIFAGLKACGGDCVAVMDCDLQHPPEKLPEMYGLWQQGFEVVEGIKNYRGKEPLIHRGLVNLFYKLLSKCTKMNMKNASDYKLLDRKVVNALIKMPEHRMFSERCRLGWDIRARRSPMMWQGGRQDQVVEKGPFRICRHFNHKLHRQSHAVCDMVRRPCFHHLDFHRRLGPCGQNFRPRHRGHDHRHFPSSVHRQHNNAHPRHNRPLHRPHIRGGSGTAEIYHRLVSRRGINFTYITKAQFKDSLNYAFLFLRFMAALYSFFLPGDL